MTFSITYQSNSEYLRVPTLRGRAVLIWKPLRMKKKKGKAQEAHRDVGM